MPKNPSNIPEPHRVAIIQNVQTPLGFFVLTVLIVEVMFGLLASISPQQRAYLVDAMMAMMLILVGIVTFLAYWRPEALSGVRPETISSQARGRSRLRPTEPSLKTIANPRVLCAATPPFESLGFAEDIKAVSTAFGKEPKVLHIESSADLRKILTVEQYDVVHLLAQINTSSGDLYCRDQEDHLSAEAMETLVKVANTRLVVLMSCDSLALAARLSRTVSVIAGLGWIDVREAKEWADCFYQMIADGKSLASAYEIARATTKCSMVLLLRDNLLFSSVARA